MLTLFQSPEIDKLGAALVAAQIAMPNVSASSSNPYFKSKYASLAEVRSATLPHLNAAGLAIIQPTRVADNGEYLLVQTVLLHTSGQWLAGEYPVRFLVKAQEMGSAITYARRYGWMALCGQAPEDDDGNLAQEGARAMEARMAARTAVRAPQPPPANPMKPVTGPRGLDSNAGGGSSGAPSAGPGGSSQVPARATSTTARVNPADVAALTAEHDKPRASYRADLNQAGGVQKRTASEIELLLQDASSEGEQALEDAWATLTPEAQNHFQSAKDRRFMPIARAIDEERQAPDDLEELLGR